MEQFWNILFQLMKHGTSVFIFSFSVVKYGIAPSPSVDVVPHVRLLFCPPLHSYLAQYVKRGAPDFRVS